MAALPAGGSASGPAHRRALEFLGLAGKARILVSGTDAVRRAVRENGVFRVVLAADTAPGQQSKLLPLLQARRVPTHVHFTRAELGAAIGRGPVSAVGLTNRKFADRGGEILAAFQAGQFTAES